jgi:hypothetical protein
MERDNHAERLGATHPHPARVGPVSSIPSGLTALALDTRIRLKWQRNPQADIVGYNIYRGGNLVPIKSVPQPPSGDLQLDDLALTNGYKYRYQVEAVDAGGNKSGISSTVYVEAVPKAGEEWEP